jgi:purine-nucleoside phosphorylase
MITLGGTMSVLVAGWSGTTVGRTLAGRPIAGPPPADISIIPTGSGWRRLEAALRRVCRHARVVGLGFCGGIHPSVGIGEIIIPLNAVPLRGVPQRQAPAHGQLAKALGDASQSIAVTHLGTIATAPRAVTADTEMTRDLADMGVLGVDMETSWLFARMASMSVPCAAILVCSDHVTHAPLVRDAGRLRQSLPLTCRSSSVARDAFRLALHVLAAEEAQR